MASSSSSTVQERRLRPIYDLLNSGNHKRVLAEVDRLLKKTPNCPPAKVVKALALIRMDKVEDAKSILEQVQSTEEEQELANLMLRDTEYNLLRCYKEINEPDTICTILESLSSKLGSEDLYIQYFMALLRMEDFGKMNRTALHMFKTFGKPTYFYWAIASTMIQFENVMGPLDFTSQLSLQLAERMIDKFLVDELQRGTLPSAHPLLLDLYSQLLWRGSTNWTKILSVLKSRGYPPSDLSTWSWDENHEIYCMALQRSGQDAELLEYLRKLFFQHNDYALIKQIVDLFGNSDMGKAFMDHLRDTHSGFVVALGNLYFAQQNKEMSDKNDNVKKDLEMVITYGLDKVNFFPDGIDQLRLADKQTQQKLLKQMASQLLVKEEDINENTSRQDIIKDVNYEFAQRELMAGEWDIVQRVNQANRCFGKYMRLMGTRNKIVAVKESNSSENLEESEEEKELDYADQYVLIAGSVLISEYCKLERKNELCQQLGSLELSRNLDDTEEAMKVIHGDELLITAICLMEHALESNPQNCTMRLILANAYARLGATREMLKILEEANIKHFQFETMGFVLFPLALTSGTYVEGLMMLRQADTMYRTFQIDTMELIISAFEHCNFKQVSDFRIFAVHLLQSTQFGLVLVELGLLNYVLYANNLNQLKTCAATVERDLDLEVMATLATGFDNRDIYLLQYLFDEVIDWEVFRETTATVDGHWYRTRLCLLTILTRLIDMVASETTLAEDVVHRELEKMEGVFNRLDECCNEWETSIKDMTVETLYFGVSPPVYARHFQLACPKFLLYQGKLVAKLFEQKEQQGIMDQLESIQKGFEEQGKELFAVLENNVSAFRTDPRFKMMQSILQDFHWVVEYFSFFKIILFVSVSRTKSCLSEEMKAKGKCKRGKNATNRPLITKSTKWAFEKLRVLLIELIEFLEKSPLPTWPDTKFSIEGALGNSNSSVETGFLVESFPTTYSKVQQKLRESYTKQLDSMKLITEVLINFVKNLEK